MGYDRKDGHYRMARKAGLRSRAAFKLEDLDREILREGARVLDLGCWPGSWLQVAAGRVGPNGRVIGIDLARVAGGLPENVDVVEGDASDEAVRAHARKLLGGRPDVVLSDMAPKLTGIRDRDRARGEELTDLALAIALEELRPGGAFVCKVFPSPGQGDLMERAKAAFREARWRRSRATRKGSSELYLVAKGRI